MNDIYSDVVGHDAIKRGLSHAVLHDRLHHALLFAGIAGVGKFTLAKAFIQSLFCAETTHEELHRCGKCSACQRIAHQVHPDVLTVETDSATLKIETIRELQRKLIYPPFESDKRFVLIRDVHKMQDAAANCLLKTLEEPEEHTTFILLTPQPQRLLSTIKSRCQIIRFAPFECDCIVNYLVEHEGVSPEYARQAAILSNGSLGQAIALTRDDYQSALLEILDTVLSVDSMDKAFPVAAQLKGKKDRFEHILSLLLTYMRDLAVLKTARDAPVMLSHYRDKMMQTIDRIEMSSIERAAKNIGDVQEAFYGNVNELVAWERLVIGMHGILFGLKK